MSHQEVQLPAEIPNCQRSPTSAQKSPIVLYSAGSPAQHKCLNGVKEALKSSSRQETETISPPEGIPMEIFCFADCVLAQSVSEGPAGRREMLVQENDESPVKGQSRVQKEQNIMLMEVKTLPELQKFDSAPELRELEANRSPNHTALASLLNMILKEQNEYEEQQKTTFRARTPEKPRNEKSRTLSTNLVNKFNLLQKGGHSHSTSMTSLQLSGDQTTEKSSRINTEPPSKTHSRMGSFHKLCIFTQPGIIWETTEVDSGTIHRSRTSRLSADYSHLVKKYEDYPTKPVDFTEEQTQNTPTLSPKRMNSEGALSTEPAKKTEKKSPKKSSPKKIVSKDFGSRIKSLKSKFFPVKPNSLQVNKTIARWPVA